MNRAIARARPGGVLFHCGAGRDRTGLVAVLLLSLGCEARGHRRDYEESSQALPALFAAVGVPDQAPVTERALRAHGTTAYDAVVDMLDHADAEAVLRDGGLSDDDIAAARHRLLP